MNKELARPVMRAIAALFLIVLVKFVAMLTLRGIYTAYSVINVVLSIAVVVVLIKFRNEFNQKIESALPDFPQVRSAVSGLVLLLVILTIYSAFLPYSEILPFGMYHIIFFLAALIPFYSLWNIFYKHSDRFLALFYPEEK